MGVGKKLKELRKKLGLTQKEFAARILGKVDYSYIGKVEREEQYPSLKMLERIAKSFSVPLSYFFEDYNDRNLLKLLPQEIKSLLEDEKIQELLRATQLLDDRDLSLVVRIINVLVQTKLQPYPQIAEEKGNYREEEKKELISKIGQALSSNTVTLSLREPWVKDALRIALTTLKKKR